MAELPKLSVRLSGAIDPRRCIEIAKMADANRYHSVWFAENAFGRGLLPAASAASAATQSIGIGIGVFNPYNRHPTLIAMEIAALDELAQGRVRLGIGSGIAASTQRMAAKPGGRESALCCNRGATTLNGESASCSRTPAASTRPTRARRPAARGISMS